MATKERIEYISGTDTAINIQVDAYNLSGKTVTASIESSDGRTTTAVLAARFTVTQTGIPSIFSWSPDGLALTRGTYRVQFTFTDGSGNVDKTIDWLPLDVR